MVNFKSTVLLLPFLARAAPVADTASQDLEPLLDNASTPLTDEFAGDIHPEELSDVDLTEDASHIEPRGKVCPQIFKEKVCSFKMPYPTDLVCHDFHGVERVCGPLYLHHRPPQVRPAGRPDFGDIRPPSKNGTRANSTLTKRPLKKAPRAETAPILEDLVIEEHGLDTVEEEDEEDDLPTAPAPAVTTGTAATTEPRTHAIFADIRARAAKMRLNPYAWTFEKKTNQVFCLDNEKNTRVCGDVVPVKTNKPARRVTFSDVVEYEPENKGEAPEKRYMPLPEEMGENVVKMLREKDEDFDADDESE